MVKRITFKSGPLKGKTYDMPDNTTRHDIAGGHYDMQGGTPKWQTKREQPAGLPHITQAHDHSEG